MELGLLFGCNMDVSTSGSPKLQILKSLEDPQRRCREPVNGTQEVLVWWDIESCPFIESCAPASLLQEIQCHLACEESRVTINVYGNGGLGSKAGMDSLIASGITLQHRILPCKLPGSETATMKTMMVDIALWALNNPAPSTIFLISTARDTCFRDLISGLHMQDYEIHLATKFNFGATEQTPSREHLFHPMPRHWSASKQLFVVRAPVPSGDNNNVQVSEALENVHLNS